MYRHDHTKLASRLPRHLAQVLKLAFVGYLAQPLEKLAVVPQVDTQHFRQAEDVLAVRERVRY